MTGRGTGVHVRFSVSLRPADVGVAGAFAVLTLLAAFHRRPHTPNHALVVEVRHAGAVHRLILAGPPRTVYAGGCVVLVSDGRVRVAASDCPHQSCVHAGWKSRSGDVIVCVPNRVVVAIVGDGSLFDAIAY